MVRRGLGERQIHDARTSKEAILKLLQDGEWHRNREILKKTQLGTATVTKHLKELAPLLEKNIDLKSGLYPYPVTYRLNSASRQIVLQYYQELLEAETHHLDRKQLRYFIHDLSSRSALMVLEFLRLYLHSPEHNLEAFNQAIEFHVISQYRDYVERLRINLEKLASKGENVESLLAGSIESYTRDYEFLKEALAKKGEWKP